MEDHLPPSTSLPCTIRLDKMDPSKLPRAKPHLPVAVVAPTVRKEPKAKSRQMNAHVTSNTSQDRSSELAQGRQGNDREPQQELQNVSRATGQTRPLQEGNFPWSPNHHIWPYRKKEGDDQLKPLQKKEKRSFICQQTYGKGDVLVWRAQRKTSHS